MPTLNQLLKKRRVKKHHKNHLKALQGCPQKKGTCIRIFTTKPKKPNSAIRKVARVRLRTGKMVTCAIIGQGHNLYQHSVVLVRGGRIKDVPGVRYKLIKGVYDFKWKERQIRAQSRSLYGTPKDQEKFL